LTPQATNLKQPVQTVQTRYQNRKKNDFIAEIDGAQPDHHRSYWHIGIMADIQKTPFVRELASSGMFPFES
jgi:hypothetical protein